MCDMNWGGVQLKDTCITPCPSKENPGAGTAEKGWNFILSGTSFPAFWDIFEYHFFLAMLLESVHKDLLSVIAHSLQSCPIKSSLLGGKFFCH